MKDRFYTRGYGAKKAWIQYYGKLPQKGLEIHHIDGNPYNNSKENLKALTPEEHDEKHRILKMRRDQRQLGNRLQLMEKQRIQHINDLAAQVEQIELFEQYERKKVATKIACPCANMNRH